MIFGCGYSFLTIEIMSRLWALSVPRRFLDLSQAWSILGFMPEPKVARHLRRLKVITLSLQTDLTIARIAAATGFSVASVKNYRATFKRGGLAALFGLRPPGRPLTPRPDALDTTLTHALERVDVVHLPFLRQWARHWGYDCPDWMLRQAVNRLLKTKLSIAACARRRRHRCAVLKSPTIHSADTQLMLDLGTQKSNGLLSWYGLRDEALAWSTGQINLSPMLFNEPRWNVRNAA